jgi:hypothetical protein
MTVFGDSIEFMVSLGVYDVVLPFLLVFTIVFAILDKTKIMGVDKGKDDREYTKKNINAMIAFVMAFFVVASSQLVAVINKTMSQVFILLLLIISFLMLAGAFHAQAKDGFFLDKKRHPFYYNAFMVIIFVAIIMIFLNALGWLEVIYTYLKGNWNASYVSAIILIAFIVGMMVWITKDNDRSSDTKKEEN